MIDYTGAQAYFAMGNHPKAAIWSAFTPPERRKGAIAAARRVIARHLGHPLDDNEPPYQEGDDRRMDFAVYEQALWMLEGDQIADATGNDPVPVMMGRASAADQRFRFPFVEFSPMTMRWLNGLPTVTTRGG